MLCTFVWKPETEFDINVNNSKLARKNKALVSHDYGKGKQNEGIINEAFIEGKDFCLRKELDKHEQPLCDINRVVVLVVAWAVEVTTQKKAYTDLWRLPDCSKEAIHD